MHFGFSYIGVLFLLMLFIPNIIWIKFKPLDYEKDKIKENKVFQWFERIGEVLVTCCALIFDDFNIKKISYWTLFLLFAFLVMLLYELYWIKYFKSERTLKDFYRSLFGIPLAGATLPILAMMLLSIYGKNIFLMSSTFLLGIGHIGIHYQHYSHLKQTI